MPYAYDLGSFLVNTVKYTVMSIPNGVIGLKDIYQCRSKIKKCTRQIIEYEAQIKTSGVKSTNTELQAKLDAALLEKRNYQIQEMQAYEKVTNMAWVIAVFASIPTGGASLVVPGVLTGVHLGNIATATYQQEKLLRKLQESREAIEQRIEELFPAQESDQNLDKTSIKEGEGLDTLRLQSELAIYEQYLHLEKDYIKNIGGNYIQLVHWGVTAGLIIGATTGNVSLEHPVGDIHSAEFLESQSWHVPVYMWTDQMVYSFVDALVEPDDSKYIDLEKTPVIPEDIRQYILTLKNNFDVSDEKLCSTLRTLFKNLNKENIDKDIRSQLSRMIINCAGTHKQHQQFLEGILDSVHKPSKTEDPQISQIEFADVIRLLSEISLSEKVVTQDGNSNVYPINRFGFNGEMIDFEVPGSENEVLSREISKAIDSLNEVDV